MGSTLKVRPPEAKTLIDKIKAEIKKRAELKAQRILKEDRSASRTRLKLNSPALHTAVPDRPLGESCCRPVILPWGMADLGVRSRVRKAKMSPVTSPSCT